MNINSFINQKKFIKSLKNFNKKFLKNWSSSLLLLYAESTTDVIFDDKGKKAKGPILVKYCFASKLAVFL